MKRIVFLHGFFASGCCVPAVAMKEAFEGKAEVMAPDLPMHPEEALGFVRELCAKVKPDVITGNSNGAFLGQIVAAETGIPAVLGNPHFRMTEFLSQRIGRHRYKYDRSDGVQDFVIDEDLIAEFAKVEEHQFDGCSEAMRDWIWGLFGVNDSLAHFEDLFREHYSNVFHFPGNHTPTAEEVKGYYVPLIERISELNINK